MRRWMDYPLRHLPQIPSGQGKWLFWLAIGCCTLWLSYWPHSVQHLRYDRAAVLSGESWRLATAHLVHLNRLHLLFNLVGLLLVCELLWGELPLIHGLGLLGAAAGGVSAMLWWLHPDLAWYVGLSGALHGLWAGCALAGCWNGQNDQRIALDWLQVPRRIWQARRGLLRSIRSIHGMALIVLGIKLATEYCNGFSMHSAQIIGEPIVTAAHLYGAVSGLCYVSLWKVICYCIPIGTLNQVLD